MSSGCSGVGSSQQAGVASSVATAALSLGLNQERTKGEQVLEMLQPALQLGKAVGKGQNLDAAG